MGLFNKESNLIRQFIGSMFPKIQNTIPQYYTVNTNPTVQACINLVSRTIGNIPLSLYVHKKGGGRAGAYFSPIFDLIQNPSIDETANLFYATLVSHLLTYGNVFIYKVRNAKGEIIALQLFDPSDITVLRPQGLNKVFHSKYLNNDLSSNEVLHIANYLGYDGTIGYSPITYGKDIINLDNKLSAYIAFYFDNSLGKSVYYSIDTDKKIDDMEKFYKTIETFNKKFNLGIENAGKFGIIPFGTKLNELNATSNAESDLRSLKLITEKSIAQLFSVPYSLISEENKYNSLADRQLIFLADCIKPICELIEQNLAKGLLNTSDLKTMYFQFDYSYLLSTDTKTQIDVLTKQLLNGILSVNEIRANLDLDYIGPEGDFRFMPVNLMPMTVENLNAYMASNKAQSVINQSEPPIDNAKK